MVKATGDIERAYAECLVRMSLEAAKESPVDWFKYIHEMAHRDAAQYSTNFDGVNALTSPAVLKLLKTISDWAKDNCSHDACSSLASIVAANIQYSSPGKIV